MNSNIIEGNWEQFKGALKEKWAKLTDQDLELMKAKGQQFYGALREKVGMKEDEFKTEFDRISDDIINKTKESNKTEYPN